MLRRARVLESVDRRASFVNLGRDEENEYFADGSPTSF
jgi:hypothetical protein